MKNICHCQCAIVIYYVSVSYNFLGADRCSENRAKDSSYDIKIGCSYDIRIGCSYDIRIGCSNGIKTAIVDK